jgi:two-component system OmpR family sensor kinase
MNSIRRTLLVWLLAGLAAIALATSGVTYVAARREVGQLLDLQLKQLAYSTRIDDLLRGRRPGFDARQAPQDAGVTELVTQIWDRDGVLVYWSQPGMGLPVPATEGYSTIRHDGRDWRVYTLVQGSHALQVAQAQDERAAIATQTALRTLVPFLALIPFFGVLIWVSVGRGLEPLDAMSKAVSKRRPNALAPLAQRALPDELQPLAASLNGLLERLSDALASQRRFTADAAHELRTPLAALKLQLDLARRAS